MPPILIVPNCRSSYDRRMVEGLAAGFRAIGQEARALPGPLPGAELARMSEASGAKVVIQVNRVRDPEHPMPRGVRHIAWFQDVFPGTADMLLEGVNQTDIVYALGDPEVLGINVRQLPCYQGSLVTGVDDATLEYAKKPVANPVDFSMCAFIPRPMPIHTGGIENILLLWDRGLNKLPVLKQSEFLWLLRKALFRPYLPLNYVPYTALRAFQEIVRKLYAPLRGALDIHELAAAMRAYLEESANLSEDAGERNKRKNGRVVRQLERMSDRRGSVGAIAKHLLSEHEIFQAGPAAQMDRAVSYFARDFPRLLDRELLINEVLKVSGTLELYGPGWHRHASFRPYARGVIDAQDELLAVYRRSRINLANNTHGLGLHSRTLECMAVGGFIFTHSSPHDDKPGGMLTSFEPGMHYGMFTPENLVEEARRWLHDTKRREKVGRNAAAIIREKHCWRHRAQQIIDDLER